MELHVLAIGIVLSLVLNRRPTWGIDSREVGCFSLSQAQFISLREQQSSNCSSPCRSTYVGRLNNPGCYCLSGTIGTLVSKARQLCQPCVSNTSQRCGHPHIPSLYMYTTCKSGKFGTLCNQDCHCPSDSICDIGSGQCSNPGFSQQLEGTTFVYFRTVPTTVEIPGEPTSQNTYIISTLVSFFVLCFLVTVIVVPLLITRERHRKRSKQRNNGNWQATEHISMETLHTGYQNFSPSPTNTIFPRPSVSRVDSASTTMNDVDEEEIYDEITDVIYDLNYEEVLSPLGVHIKQTSEGPSPYQEEYEKIQIRNQNSGEHEIQPNICENKNDLGDAIIYDNSRVHLMRINKNDDSQYIKANYINGYKQPKAFIAMQGPVKGTVEYFWRMCWEQNVSIIVMLSSFVENATVKTVQYWPDAGEAQVVGVYTVRALRQATLSSYTIRHFKLSLGHTTRYICQFQFLDWPSEGVPLQAALLLNFHRRIKVTARLTREKVGVLGPIVVHCCGGGGRTGIYIAMDIVLEKVMEEDAINVFSCVNTMCDQRANMVHTLAEYSFIYTLVLEAAMVGVTSVPCDAFSMLHPLVPDAQNRRIKELEKQLKVLNLVKPKYPNNMASAESIFNVTKKRKSYILPAKLLKPQVKHTTDNINAVFVQGYYNRQAFLVTQAPMVDMQVDFWRMVDDYNCVSVICLVDYEHTDKIMPLCWSRGKPLVFKPFYIRYINDVTNSAGVTMTTLMLSKNVQGDDARRVVIFSLADLSAYAHDEVPALKQFSLRDAVSGRSRVVMSDAATATSDNVTATSDTDRTVIVMCRDGVTRCGVYCALDYIVDMIEHEQVVDIFQAVRNVQMSQPQFVKDKKQYQFLHTAARLYITQNINYDNFIPSGTLNITSNTLPVTYSNAITT